jgi:hypothetical protein
MQRWNVAVAGHNPVRRLAGVSRQRKYRGCSRSHREHETSIADQYISSNKCKLDPNRPLSPTKPLPDGGADRGRSRELNANAINIEKAKTPFRNQRIFQYRESRQEDKLHFPEAPQSGRFHSLRRALRRL